MHTPRHGSSRRDLLSPLELAEALFDGTDECVLLATAAGEAQAVRGTAPIEDLTGYSLEELVDDPAKALREGDVERVLAAYQRVVTAPGHRASTTFLIQHRDGQLVEVRATAVNRLLDRVLSSVVIRLRTVGAEVSGRPPPIADESTDSGGVHPAGLVTRDVFVETVKAAIARKERKIWQATRHARSVQRDRRFDYTLVVLELDRFKILVSGFGHQVMDSVLTQVCDRLSQALRGRDVFAHLGGGDFGILLDAVGDGQQATRVCDRISAAFDDRFNAAGNKVAVQPVMGFATSERHYEQVDELMRDAAAAASHAGANRSTKRRRAAFQSQMRHEDKLLMDLIVALNEGVEHQQFRVGYQPVISLGTGALVGFEALARWTHPRLGEVSPATFIAVAEDSGLMVEIGRMIMRQACEQVSAWNAMRPHAPLTINVNISGAQLADAHFLTDVEHALRDSGLAPESLCLEITEGVVLDNIEVAVGAIARLRLYGVRVSLDDFGTGYSSLGYLHRLNYDSIKIDKSFMGAGGLKNRIIVAAIIALAHKLDMQVVAEGVETAEQAAALVELGCDLAQGFLYAPALFPQEAAQYAQIGEHK